MQTPSNRTFICSVVFLDFVEYSRKPVAEQIRLKEQLNVLLTEALADVAPNDRIILDTGDGAALSFLGDPEDALFVSLSLRDAVSSLPGGPGIKMRIGINLGPVRLVKDINGQPNIIGDGINVAQRVMAFCEPGQVLVSRSYYEVVSCLSEDYGKLFHYEGARTDKHVREHEVYAVEGSAAVPRSSRTSERARTGPTNPGRLTQTTEFVTGNLRRKPRLATAITVAAILLVSVGIRAGRHSAPAPVAPPAEVAMAVPAEPETAPAAAPQAASAQPKPAAIESTTQKPAPAPAKPATASTKPATRPQKEEVTTRPPPFGWASIFGSRQEREEPATASAPAVAAAPEPAEPEPAVPTGTGTLIFTVSPWAEIYVDGTRRGEIPPMYELKVAAGRHRIELRHPEYPANTRTVVVRPGSKVEVKHWFLPKEQPNPFEKPPWR